MRDNVKVQEVLTNWHPVNWRYAVVYDEPLSTGLDHRPYSPWDFQVATDIDGLNAIMSEINDRGIDLHPEIWTREITVKICPPATYTS